MSDNKLTNQEVARVFAMYLGCETVYSKSRYPYLKGDSAGVCSGERIGSVYAGFYFKLLLTPLSSITDEHAIEVFKMFMPFPFSKYTTGWVVTRDFAITGFPYIKIHHPKNVYSLMIDCTLCNFNLYNMEDNITSEIDMQPSQVTQFLTNEGYAVPLFFAPNHWGNSKTAIELNIAIDKSKLK